MDVRSNKGTDAMHNDLHDQFNNLTDAVTAQTAGLMKLLQITATHGEMLKAILAALEESAGDGSLADALKQLATAVQANGETLHRVEGAIANRPLS